MEADRSLKHFCKFCNKRFRCGRSLGGHMRSHLMNIGHQFKPKLSRGKLQALNNGGSNSTYSGYGLRENPKRNSNNQNQDSENSNQGKFCRECGKEFKSWKALFGHMKCHSEKMKTSIKMEDQESWSLKPATSSSFSIANSSSSATEIDQEQEEIALCLIMLSRDLSNWGGINSITESSDYSSELEKHHRTKFEINLGKNSDPKLGSKYQKTSKINHPDSEIYRNSQKRSKFECSSCRKIFHSYQALGGHKASHRKMKNCLDSTMAMNEKQSKRRIHECPICLKLFSSGQALGGHKRSHLFGCSEKMAEIRDFLDLNLPAPVDEELEASSVDPWWIKSISENERVLGLISDQASLNHSHGF